jgi:hypothetical protein
MSHPTPWTVAVADSANISHPSIAYVTVADTRADAIATVTARHSATYAIPVDRILVVDAFCGTPPVDAFYGWTDLRGIPAIRLVLEPDQVRQLARLRLRLRRWHRMLAPYLGEPPGDDAVEIPPLMCNAYTDEAEAIAETLAALLLPPPGQ